MVIRLGRNGRFLACSEYPEHKETRPLPGDEPPPQEGTGETCPECGQGTLVAKNGRFGPFVGCDRYPDCGYIKREGPEPPPPLPFDVVCPKNADGKLVARRARRTGNVFWGCSNYPKCDYTTNHEPVGALHDADDGPVGEEGRRPSVPEVRRGRRGAGGRGRGRPAPARRPTEPGGARAGAARWRAPGRGAAPWWAPVGRRPGGGRRGVAQHADVVNDVIRTRRAG